MVMQMSVLKVVLTVNLTVATAIVLLVHGHVTVGVTVQTVQTKLIAVAMMVVQAVLMVNLTVVMAIV